VNTGVSVEPVRLVKEALTSKSIKLLYKALDHVKPHWRQTCVGLCKENQRESNHEVVEHRILLLL